MVEKNPFLLKEVIDGYESSSRKLKIGKVLSDQEKMCIVVLLVHYWTMRDSMTSAVLFQVFFKGLWLPWVAAVVVQVNALFRLQHE